MVGEFFLLTIFGAHAKPCVWGYINKNPKNTAGAVGALPLVCSIVCLLVSELPSATRYYPPAYRQQHHHRP